MDAGGTEGQGRLAENVEQGAARPFRIEVGLVDAVLGQLQVDLLAHLGIDLLGAALVDAERPFALLKREGQFLVLAGAGRATTGPR